MKDFFSSEMISLLALFTSLMATLVLILVGRRALMSSKEARLSALDELIDDRKSMLGDKGALEAEVETLSKKQEQLQALTQALLNDLEPLKSKHADAVLEYEKQKEKLRTLREEWRQLQDKVELYEKRIKQLNELEEEIKGLGAQRDALKAEVESLPKVKEELEKIGTELKQAQESKQKLEEEITKTESEKAKRDGELKDLETQLAARTEDLVDLEKKIAQREEDLKKREQDLHDTKVQLDARRSELKTIGQIPKGAFKSLSTPWLTKAPNPLQSADEMQALDRLGRLVNESGFHLSKRLQYAFHTSLKTSDISCLTVMAGVSGTGKSAFPKLYAQAMGIHFLPLAVEPRWDSPQDLFGFLNYMENRYEATTLGRALVQFNNSPYRDQNHHAPMHNQVLMVLLDEMNLARIEYYFSEFLSKLEMRRNANTHAIEDYNNISLEVYAGHGKDEENGIEACPAIRLFAGENILFVGTMNEDESTQSLSDKVIDRANVIHFGRPDRMKNVDLKISRQRQEPISYDVWCGWLKEPDGNTIQNIQGMENLLNDINSVLGDLGRPFGWRNYKAILTYIANYPEQDKPMRAMADQVAMRVMPKLRGLDLGEHAEAFSRFKNMLVQINDPALTRAFEDASNNAMGFFNWRGLNWDS
jgi:predicted  nucleic acid-binding Zn-ribbon protein